MIVTYHNEHLGDDLISSNWSAGSICALPGFLSLSPADQTLCDEMKYLLRFRGPQQLIMVDGAFS
jgi:hypothetical protein